VPAAALGDGLAGGSWYMLAAMNDDRVELESKIAVLERTIEALSGELHLHTQRIQELQDAVKLLAEQMARAKSGEEIEPHDTKPPHYGG